MLVFITEMNEELDTGSKIWTHGFWCHGTFNRNHIDQLIALDRHQTNSLLVKLCKTLLYLFYN